MAAKQSQIVSFFQNIKRKRIDNADQITLSADISSSYSNETQREKELCTEISSIESPPSNASTSLTSSLSTLFSSTACSSPSTTIGPTLFSPIPSSSTVTSPSSTSSPSALGISLLTVGSPSALSTSSSAPVSSPSVSSEIKLNYELTCCNIDEQFIPQNQPDVKSLSDKRSCQLTWFVMDK